MTDYTDTLLHGIQKSLESIDSTLENEFTHVNGVTSTVKLTSTQLTELHRTVNGIYAAFLVIRSSMALVRLVVIVIAVAVIADVVHH